MSQPPSKFVVVVTIVYRHESSGATSIDCEHLCSILSVLVWGHDLLQPPSVHNQRDIQSVVSANTPLVRGGYCVYI